MLARMPGALMQGNSRLNSCERVYGPWALDTHARTIMPVIHARAEPDILAYVQVAGMRGGRRRCRSTVAGMHTVKAQFIMRASTNSSVHACMNSRARPATVPACICVRAGVARQFMHSAIRTYSNGIHALLHSRWTLIANAHNRECDRVSLGDRGSLTLLTASGAGFL